MRCAGDCRASSRSSSPAGLGSATCVWVLSVTALLWMPPLLGGVVVVVAAAVILRVQRGLRGYDAEDPRAWG